MGIIKSIFVKTKREIGGFKFDGTLSETHSNTIRVTKNPVEFGADVTDHSIIEPKVVKIRGVVTDTLLGLAGAAAAIANFGSKETRSQTAYTELIKLMEEREPIEIFTKLVNYKTMVITSINVTQDKTSSGAIFVDLTAQEVRLVETAVVVSNFSPSPTINQASNAAKGTQKTSTVSETSAVGKSILSKMTGAFF